MKQKSILAFCLLMSIATGLFSCKKNKDAAPSTLTVDTFAGSGIGGDADGSGPVAQFSAPIAMTADAQGNIFVASGSAIKKITPAGQVSTFAGIYNIAGFTDGTGVQARFSNPLGMSTDPQGNVYVADYGNQRIRKISPAGLVTTIAGNGTIGSNNGNGSAAQFNYPYDIAYDGTTGCLFVADYQNNRIRKIDAAGNVSTYAGSAPGFADGTVSSALFFGPMGVAADKQGNVFVSDRYNHRVRKITNTGTVSTVAGSSNVGLTNGPLATALFSGSINELEVDNDGNIYLADRDNYCVRKISSTEVTTYAGSGIAGYVEGAPGTAQFNGVFGLALYGNTVYVADLNNHRVRRISYK